MEKEVGGGIGMGNTCKPMADSSQCMTKPTTIKIIIIIIKRRNTKKKTSCLEHRKYSKMLAIIIKEERFHELGDS